MKTFLVLSTVVFLLAGCQSPFPNTVKKNYGAVVHNTLASQIIAPQAHPEQGADGAAGAAAYTNYQRSYVTPVPQNASPSFGSK